MKPYRIGTVVRQLGTEEKIAGWERPHALYRRDRSTCRFLYVFIAVYGIFESS